MVMRQSILVLILLVPMLFAPAGGEELRTSTIHQQNSFGIQQTSSYSEDINYRFTENGFIETYVSLNGFAPIYGSTNLGTSLPSSVSNILQYASVSFQEPMHVDDTNVNFNFRFSTTSTTIAESAANSLLALIEAETPLTNRQIADVFVSGSETYVTGDARLDWPQAGSVIDRSVPRPNGGVAKTLNVTEANWFQFSMYKVGSGYDASLNVNFRDPISAQTGGFSFDLVSFARIDWAAPPSSDNLQLSIELPGVTSPALSISNSSNTDIFFKTFEEENRVRQVYDIWLKSGANYSTIVLTFDHTFTQYNWENREKVSWDIDQRGYIRALASINGLDRVAPTTNLLANSSLFVDLVELRFELRRTEASNFTGWIEFFYSDGYSFADAYSKASAIISELSSLGVNFVYGGNHTDWDGQDTGLLDYYEFHNETDPDNPMRVDGLRFDLDGKMNNTMFSSTFIPSLYVYSRSAVVQAINLTEVTKFSWNLHYERWGLGAEINLEHEQYPEYLPTLVPAFAQNIQQAFSGQLLNMPVFNLNGVLPWSSYSGTLQLTFHSETTQQTSINVEPVEKNGFGYSLYNDSWYDSSRMHGTVYMDVTISKPIQYIQDTNGNNITQISNYNFTFVNKYYDDTVDLQPPYLSPMYYYNASLTNYPYNGYTNYSQLNHGQRVSGSVNVMTVVDDATWPYYFNGTHFISRFPSSGIKSVNAHMYRSDAPITHSTFTKTFSLIENTSWVDATPDRKAFDGVLNTTLLADGEWNIEANVSDNAGNVGYNFIGSVIVDNYDDNLPAATAYFTSVSDGQSIGDKVTFNFTVADETGIFATILWIGPAGYIMTPVSTVTNSSGVFHYYSFDFDVLASKLPEGYSLPLGIKTLDMDGHWTSTIINVLIDNIPSGNPPTVEAVSPLDGEVFNNTLTQTISFVANVTDDIGIKSVELEISGAQQFTFNMFLDNSTGLYRFDANISTWSLGSYSFKVIVVDKDENTHTVSSVTRTFSIVGVAPTQSDTTAPIISNVAPFNNSEVSGTVTISATVTDDTAVAQVTVTLPDGSVNEMAKGSENTYTYDWDSSTVADGGAVLTIKAKDSGGNENSYVLVLIASNGRTNQTPELGLPVPGFEAYLALFAMIGIVVYRKRRF